MGAFSQATHSVTKLHEAPAWVVERWPPGTQTRAAFWAAALLPGGLQSKKTAPAGGVPVSCFVWQAVPPPQQAVPSQQSAPQVTPVVQAQAPELHVCPAGQARPQAPQLAASVWRSTHAAPHLSWPAGQTQWPAAQLWAAPQAVPQAPQFARSVARSTQA